MPREAERANTSALLPEPGETELPGELALLAQFQAAEEMGKGAIQIAQGFLRGTLGHFIHPGEIGLLEGVECSMQLESVGTFPRGPVHFLRASQSPIVGKAGTAGMLQARGSLLIIQV
ncbi:hypothetical protein A4R35_03770 [Thermogemmatispora tikiterensis]|uniref:Uncharacterized protein n=1 Tax=Thermogemmatispora tikiterensis TaxID=1825093 RepID=A0A328VCS0_9CHLR|nr:hypothetical protein A4R35_03770 [Thermogemmatispora tikiterensis]